MKKQPEKVIVPICNICGKPHYGRRNVNDRCICDCSGQWTWGEITFEKDKIDPKELKENE